MRHATGFLRNALLALTLALSLASCGDGGPSLPAAAQPTRVRDAVHAGAWYPGDPEVLRREIETLLAGWAPTPGPGPIIAMIAPHAGLRFSGAVAAASYRPLREQQVERVFLLGPSHRARYQGIALPAPDLRAYATPLGELPIDRGAVDALRGRSGFTGPSAAHDREHSLEMHAIFLAAVHPGVRLVPLVVGRLGDAAQTRAIASQLRGLLEPSDVVMASSDFTHYGPNYGYQPFRDDVPRRLAELLRGAVAPLLDPDLEAFDAHLAKTGDTICGREPIRLLLALLPDSVSSQQVADDTSGRITGDYRNSVSYLSALYHRSGGWPRAAGPQHGAHLQQGPQVLDVRGRAVALQLARRTLESFLETGRVPDEDELEVPAAGPFREVYGTFVTLKKDGRLRGCVGHIFPVQSLWRDLRENAIAAAVHDRRFPPVQASELDDLQMEISVLTHPEAIPDPDAFVVGRHGVVLNALGRQSVFLPQVAPEQGWDRDTTLSYLARKAGLKAEVWRTPAARLDVFEAQVFAEPTLAD
jgi:AmmeMemoRadiSam system protein B/AmmeMemoRadiSam system protein A